MKARKQILSLFNCFIVISLLFLFITSCFLPPPAYAQNPEPWSKPRCVQDVNIGTEAKPNIITDIPTLQGFECIFINLTRVLVPLAGLLLFVMLVVGSFQLITAGGEAKALQKARGTLTFAIAGLVIFLGIWFILLLIRTITGVDVTKFEIPGGPSGTP